MKVNKADLELFMIGNLVDLSNLEVDFHSVLKYFPII